MAACCRPTSSTDVSVFDGAEGPRSRGPFCLHETRERNIRRWQAFVSEDRKQGMRMKLRGWHLFMVLLAVMLAMPGTARAETLKIFTAGAFKQVLLAVLPQFQAAGHDVQWETDTVGGLVKRINAGESFDLVFASPAALETLGKSGKIAGRVDLARVGVGVAIKDGAAKPDLSTVDGFKTMLLAAKGVAYIDPASGGSSGIYVAALIDRLGIGDQVRSKSVLVKGGYSAERVVSGEAEIAIQQISEILPVKGVVFAGPLPREIQNYTVYSAAIAKDNSKAPSAQVLIDLLHTAAGQASIIAKGMESIAPTK
jgi:molybdate transport system substrate-binding protein